MTSNARVQNDIVTDLEGRHKHHISLRGPVDMNIFQKHTPTPVVLLLNWEEVL
jgi:hypothetical protein